MIKSFEMYIQERKIHQAYQVKMATDEWFKSEASGTKPPKHSEGQLNNLFVSFAKPPDFLAISVSGMRIGAYVVSSFATEVAFTAGLSALARANGYGGIARFLFPYAKWAGYNAPKGVHFAKEVAGGAKLGIGYLDDVGLHSGKAVKAAAKGAQASSKLASKGTISFTAMGPQIALAAALIVAQWGIERAMQVIEAKEKAENMIHDAKLPVDLETFLNESGGGEAAFMYFALMADASPAPGERPYHPTLYKACADAAARAKKIGYNKSSFPEQKKRFRQLKKKGNWRESIWLTVGDNDEISFRLHVVTRK